jgi:hypothetical protein
MPRYKTVVPQKKSGVEFLRFVEKVPKKLTVNEWSFPKGQQYLFRCYVGKEDGLDVDKIWTVWDYESTKQLKKKLGLKGNSPKELTATMHSVDDESTFEIK